jgi:TRAP-type uncharacterized transport system substrate-binding protein
MRTLAFGVALGLGTALLSHAVGFSPLNPGWVSSAQAQAIPKSIEAAGPDQELKNRKNNWTVGVAGGQLSGSYMTFADELGQVLDDGDNLRIIPMVTYGAASNMDDLLYLRGVDIAVTQSDVFEYFRTQRKTPNLDQRINYIIRLPVSELHILARNEIRSLEDLRGKKVSFGPQGAGSSLTGSIVFQRLGIKVEQLFLDNPTATQKLKTGEISALMRQIGKPIDVFAKMPKDSGFHFLPIPFSKTFSDYYTIGEFTNKDYPGLVPEGTSVDTIAVPAVMAVFNWPKGHDRYRRVARMVESMFTNWEKFRQPPRHPKWRDVNLAATVPGWTRWSVAEEMLKKMQPQGAADPQVASGDFATFLRSSGAVNANLTPEQREKLFREYMQWQAAQRGARQPQR